MEGGFLGSGTFLRLCPRLTPGPRGRACGARGEMGGAWRGYKHVTPSELGAGAGRSAGVEIQRPSCSSCESYKSCSTKQEIRDRRRPVFLRKLHHYGTGVPEPVFSCVSNFRLAVLFADEHEVVHECDKHAAADDVADGHIKEICRDGPKGNLGGQLQIDRW